MSPGCSVTFSVEIDSRPPSGIESRALIAILTSASANSDRSTRIGQVPLAMPIDRSMFTRVEPERTSRMASTAAAG
jgi:hypothetical protein